jgi:hypothetical protein
MITHDDNELGPTEFFQGAMTTLNSRQAKTLRVIDAATFSNLIMMYPAGGAASIPPPPPGPHVDAINAKDIASYPAGTIIRFVKSFQLTAGSVRATYIT